MSLSMSMADNVSFDMNVNGCQALEECSVHVLCSRAVKLPRSFHRKFPLKYKNNKYFATNQIVHSIKFSVHKFCLFRNTHCIAMPLLEIPDPLSSPSIEDFNVICRICLRKGGWDGVVCVQPIGAYIDRLNPEKEQDLYEKIRMCSNIELHHNDDVLPNNICDNCVNLLFIAHYFKQLTANSDSILRRIVSSVDEKPVTAVKLEWDDQHDWDSYEDRDDDSPLCDIDVHSPEQELFDFDNRVYICDVCQLRFSDKSSLSDHMISHKDTSLTDHTYLKDEDNLALAGHIECKLEITPVSAAKDLKNSHKSEKVSKRHKEKCVKNNKDNDIKICKKVEIKVEADDNINLEESKQDDSNIDEPENIGYYECLVCNTKFRCKEDLSKHMYSHNNLGKYKCYGCDVVFDKYSKRTHHEKYCCPNMPPGTKYECSKCKVKCDNRFRFDTHIKFGCAYQPPRPEMKTIELEPLLKCPHCDLTTMKRATLRNHILNCHTAEKPYICEICGKGYAMVSTLNGHRKQAHCVEKRFKCSYCPYAARQQSSLNVHTRRHTLEYRYSCEICGASFKQNTGYHIHMRRHHREKEFHQCDICKKSFSEKAALKSHVSSVHLGLKPHECKVCGAAYSRKRSLKAHLLRVHNIVMAKNTLFDQVVQVETVVANTVAS